MPKCIVAKNYSSQEPAARVQSDSRRGQRPVPAMETFATSCSTLERHLERQLNLYRGARSWIDFCIQDTSKEEQRMHKRHTRDISLQDFSGEARYSLFEEETFSAAPCSNETSSDGGSISQGYWPKARFGRPSGE